MREERISFSEHYCKKLPELITIEVRSGSLTLFAINGVTSLFQDLPTDCMFNFHIFYATCIKQKEMQFGCRNF